MSNTTRPQLSAGLIATKGSAAPAADMPPRAMAAEVPVPKEGRAGELSEPLNFKVPQSFRREFKAYAGAHGLKLNQLLLRSFEAYRKQQGD